MLLPLLLSAAAATDTLVVATAQMEEPYTLQQPYTTEAQNVQGQTFDWQQVFDRNASLAASSSVRQTNTTTIAKGTAFSVAQDSMPQIRALHFNIQTDRYTKANVVIKHLSRYKLFANGQVCNGGQLTLMPGRTEMTLLTLTEKTSRDSFDVQIVGDLAGVQVNATGKHPMTMTDMLCGEHYSNVALSPSGRYLVTTMYYTKQDGNAQYTTILTDLKNDREVWRRNEYADLRWLPNTQSDQLFYTRQGGNGKELVVYTPADGKETVWADRLPEGSFSVSPKGDYLIISQAEEKGSWNNGLKMLQQPDDRQPGWRSRNALWRYDLKSGLMQQLTFGTTSVWLADISHDGTKLLLQYSHFDAHRAPFDRATLVQMDAYTGKVDTLLADTIFIAGAKYSPDGQALLVKASPASFGGIGSEVKEGQFPNSFDYRLYLYNIASRQTIPLLRHFNPSVEDFIWSPGDGMVYFTATDRSDRTFYRLNPQSRQAIRYELPITCVSRFTLATAAKSAPRMVCFGQSAERAREMYLCELNKAQPAARRIGAIKFEKLYADVEIGTCHNWTFQAQRGDTIDGFYFLPPHFDATQKYPLIVYYYGGCMPSTRCLEYQYPLQVFASQGYVVYVPNPSGAIGYGQEFAARHVNTWGHESGDDIIEGTRKFCAAHSFVDSARVGCMGASYGGFMTEYLQTRTNLFAAAVSHAGISNIASYWGGGYWGYSYGECAQYGSYPWNNPDLYVKQSSLFSADKIHTPLLLLHGTADTNVPPTESQQLYTALKILGRDVAYIQIDGENHVITNFAKRLAWQNAIFAWFAKYLKNEPAWWDSVKNQ